MTTPHYRRLFDPPADPPPADREANRFADQATPQSYVFDDDVVLAVNLALATGRPLLLRGRPGSGKSSLAAAVAHWLGRRLYSHTVTSRTQAQDLLWTVDEVARLSDAATDPDRARNRARYVQPGPLWWAFDPASARRRGVPAKQPAVEPARDPGTGPSSARGTVILLDEIDKADPDVPNDLLEPLGWYQFPTQEQVVVTASGRPLVMITTNEERELPKAFLRRCIVHAIAPPDRARLVAVAVAHLGAAPAGDDLYDLIARALPLTSDGSPDTSVAEYLDLVRAARGLGLRPADPAWSQILAAAGTAG